MNFQTFGINYNNSGFEGPTGGGQEGKTYDNSKIYYIKTPIARPLHQSYPSRTIPTMRESLLFLYNFGTNGTYPNHPRITSKDVT